MNSPQDDCFIPGCTRLGDLHSLVEQKGEEFSLLDDATVGCGQWRVLVQQHRSSEWILASGIRGTGKGENSI